MAKGRGNAEYENQAKYRQEFNKNTYDRMEIIMPKGDKQKVKDYAKSKGESLNGFVNRAIKQAMGESE